MDKNDLCITEFHQMKKTSDESKRVVPHGCEVGQKNM